MHRNTAVTWIVLGLLAGSAWGQSFAGSWVSYDQGTTPTEKWNWVVDSWDPYQGHMEYAGTFNSPSAAVGKPDGITEGFAGDNILSPFNPAGELDEVCSIGEGGHLTLALQNYVVVDADPTTKELGIFGNAGLIDASWSDADPGNDGTGVAGSPVSLLGPDVAVQIEVSRDGAAGTWVNLGLVSTDMVVNYYSDASSPYLASSAGLTEADFGLPQDGGLQDFAGMTYAEILTELGGSTGGKWLDLSGSGLAEVGYVRFTVLDDGIEDAWGDDGSGNPVPIPAPVLNVEIDAVSIANGHVGDPIPEPATIGLLCLGGVALLRRERI